MRKFILFFLIIILTAFNGIEKQTAQSPIRILLLSGNNNHEWQKTTPMMQSVFKQSGLFTVTITERPDTLTSHSLRQFQVILSNWNSWPEKKCTWTAETKTAILNFVQNGGGIVFVHSAGSANYDWPEYQNMGVASWGDSTKHGKVESFQVKFSKSEDPVTNGMIDYWTTDELWVDSRISGKPIVLAEAFAPVSNNGSDEMEPILFCNKFGKGRSFSLLLGHDEQAMKNLGFQTLLLRGTEWSASGKVSQAIPEELKFRPNTATKLSWKKEKYALTLLNNDQIIWQYHFDPSEGKPYFHPLSALDGTVLTGLRPTDHPWHRAVWFSWKYINGLNYWEEDLETGKSEGITELKSSNQKTNDFGEAELTHEIAYKPPQGADLLAEKRTIRVSAQNPDGSYFMDWQSTFTALAPEVVLDRTPLPDEPEGKSWGGYAGFSVRLSNNLWNIAAINDQQKSGELHGKPSRWMTYQMKNLSGNPVCLTIFDHPSNVGFPNKWFISIDDKTPFYYFSPAPLFGGKIVLKKGQQLHLKYRMLVNSEEIDQIKIQTNWNQFKN